MKIHQIISLSLSSLFSLMFACTPCTYQLSSQCISTYLNQSKTHLHQIHENDKKIIRLDAAFERDLKSIKAKLNLVKQYKSQFQRPYWSFYVPPKCRMGRQTIKKKAQMALRFAQGSARIELAKSQAKEENQVAQNRGVSQIKETLAGVLPKKNVITHKYAYSLVCFEEARFEEPVVKGELKKLNFARSSHKEIKEMLNPEYAKLVKIKAIKPYLQHQANWSVSLEQEIRHLKRLKTDRKRSFRKQIQTLEKDTRTQFNTLKRLIYSTLYPKSTETHTMDEDDFFNRVAQGDLYGKSEKAAQEQDAVESILGFFIHPLLLERLVFPLEQIELYKGEELHFDFPPQNIGKSISNLLNFKDLKRFEKDVKEWKSILEDQIKKTKSKIKWSTFLTLITKVYVYNYLASSSKTGPFKSFCKSAHVPKNSKPPVFPHLEQLQQQRHKWSQDPKKQRLSYLLALLQEGFQTSVSRCASHIHFLEDLTSWMNRVEYK